MTYTAADQDGNIIGGGIGPGVQVKIRALSDYASAIPHVPFESIVKEVESLTDREGNVQKKLPVFARTTEQNIVSNVCLEIASTGQSVIQSFLKQVEVAQQNDVSMDLDATRRNPVREIFVTGGDATLLARLIGPSCDLLEFVPGSKPSSPPTYQVKAMKHMTHYGMACVLRKNSDEFQKSPSADMDTVLIGQRVAKKFPVSDQDGDYVFRGSVACVHADDSEYPYGVRYDDGDSEDMTVVQLYGTFNFLKWITVTKFFLCCITYIHSLYICRGSGTLHPGWREGSSCR
jgi:hypothetical protein